MVRSRGESPAQGDANLMPASVPDIGRSLRLARERAELTVGEAAARAGLSSAVVEALESGNVGPQHDRIATLRALRTYADSLGLPGDDYVLVAVEQWPAVGPLPTHRRRHRRGAGGLDLLGAGGRALPGRGHGSVWPGDATGVTDATTTGVIETRPATSRERHRPLARARHRPGPRRRHRRGARRQPRGAAAAQVHGRAGRRSWSCSAPPP